MSLWLKFAAGAVIVLLTFSGAMMTMLYKHQVNSVVAEVEARNNLSDKLDYAIEKLDGRLRHVETTISGFGTNIDNLVTTCADIKKDIRELRSP